MQRILTMIEIAVFDSKPYDREYLKAHTDQHKAVSLALEKEATCKLLEPGACRATLQKRGPAISLVHGPRRSQKWKMMPVVKPWSNSLGEVIGKKYPARMSKPAAKP